MITRKPLRYDFPNRMRGLASAHREVRRLERAMAVADDRRDAQAFAYLNRRHQRATRALAALRRREDDAPGLGSSCCAHACTHTSGDEDAA